VRTSAAVICTAAFLAAAGGAGAHVFPTPTYVARGETTRVELSVPNERRVPMTEFELSAPTGLAIAEAAQLDGWTSSATRRRALWTDGSLPSFATVNFATRLDVSREPGTVVLDAVERYEDGASVRWPMTLVVVPADEPSQQLGVALLVGLVGLLVLTIGAGLLWRRAGRSLQER
jgi:hypothetical protein